jgi:hypothetical protein
MASAQEAIGETATQSVVVAVDRLSPCIFHVVAALSIPSFLIIRTDRSRYFAILICIL